MHTVTKSAKAQVSASFIGGDRGFSAWFTSSDHKRTALVFMALTLVAFWMGMNLTYLPQAKALGATGIGSRIFLQTVTYQRLFMVMAWLVPVLPCCVGFFVLPLQLGARNMALPALTRASLYFYAAGLLLMFGSLMAGAMGSGWTLDTPLSLLDPGSLLVLAVSLVLLALSWFVTGLNLVVTVHQCRAEGMGFFDMPHATWGFYLTGFVLILSGALFAVAVIYLIASQMSGGSLFGADADPMLWRRYFWAALRPAAYFAMVPAIGIVSDVISGVARKASAGYKVIVGAMMALTAIGIVSYGANLVGQGLDGPNTLVFSFLSLLAVVPAALISFTWLSTLFRSSVACAAPTWFTIAFTANAAMVGVTGLFLASPSLGQYLGASMFASAQLDYVLWGGVLSAFFAGIHFWWPKMMGREYSHDVASIGLALYLVGLNMALVPRLIMGTRGVPQDLTGLVPHSLFLAEFSSLGWLFVYFGLTVIVGNLLVTVWGDEASEENPWGAEGYEWTVASPPVKNNFGDTASG